MYFGIRILPIRSQDGPRFMLSAAPQGLGGSAPTITLGKWDWLAAALGSVNIDAGDIDKARKKALEELQAHTIPNVLLTDEQLEKLGLKRE